MKNREITDLEIISAAKCSTSLVAIFKKLDVKSNIYLQLRMRRLINENNLEGRFRFKKSLPIFEENFKNYNKNKKLSEELGRKDPNQTARYIYYSTNSKDKTHHLSIEEIKNKLSEADNKCCYCLSDKLKLTLDRIDNEKAHESNNVHVACIRCNYLRGNMPYEAWTCLLPGLRLAEEKGLFGMWRSKPIRQKV